MLNITGLLFISQLKQSDLLHSNILISMFFLGLKDKKMIHFVTRNRKITDFMLNKLIIGFV